MNYALCFAVGELFALMLFLITLHWLRRIVGIFPLYLLLGLFFIFSQLSIIPPIIEFFSVQQTPGVLYNGFLMLPVVLTYLLFYEDEGTMEAQRIIFGLIVATLGFLYLVQLIVSQIHFTPDKQLPEFWAILIQDDAFTHPFLCLSFFHIALLLLTPVSYQLTRNMHFPIAITLWINTAIFFGFSYSFQSWFSSTENNPVILIKLIVIFAWGIALAIVCTIMQFYIAIAGHVQFRKKRPLGIFSGLFLQVQSAAKMRQSVEEWEDRYQIVFDNAVDMIFLLEKHGNVINANRSALKTLGSRSYIDGFSLIPFLKNEDGSSFDWEAAWRKIWGKALTPDKSLTLPNMLLDIPNSTPINIAFNLSSARINDQELAVLLLHDITVQRREEEKRKQLEEQLIHSQRLESLGTLAGGVAHDFNNMLQGIQASTEAIRMSGPLTPESTTMLDNIQSATMRAADLTQKLLGFARKGKYMPQRLNIATVAKKAAALFDVGHKSCMFKLLAPPENIYVFGDDTQLQQVILNLLINAKDALKEGSVEDRRISLRIDFATEDMPAWQKKSIPDANPKDYVSLRIRDNGKGMDEQTITHIFEPFYSTKGVKGTGLGLSMAYGCITNHHGWMDVSSEIGKGTEITIFLPISTQNKETEQ